MGGGLIPGGSEGVVVRRVCEEEGESRVGTGCLVEGAGGGW